MQTFSESPAPSIQPTPLNSAKSGAKPSSRDVEKEKINQEEEEKRWKEELERKSLLIPKWMNELFEH